jgi:hypothetical protein
MTPRKTFFAVCLIVSVICLATGYGFVGQWIGVVIAIAMGPAWLFAQKYPTSGLPFICLFASVCLAVTGKLTGSSSLLMICGSGFALAIWDLLLLDDALRNSSCGEQTRQYENKHLQSLVLALGSGLLAALFGRFLHLQIPFIILMFFIALVIFGLDRVWGYIKKTG